MADSTKINSSLNKEKRNIISTEAGWLAVRQTRNNIIIIMIDVECYARLAGGPCQRTIAVTCSCSGFPVGRFAVYISLNDGTVICDKIKDDKVKISLFYQLMIESINNSKIEHPNPIAIGSEIYIEQIRQELTCTLRRNVLYPAEKIEHVRLVEDDDAVHFGAFRDGMLVGVVSLFQRGTDFQFRKLAVDRSAQKMGVGTALLTYITEQTRENSGLRIWCNARTTATGFYLKNGFKLTGESFSKNNIDYVVMDKLIVPIT